jgi:hypothetical protein
MTDAELKSILDRGGIPYVLYEGEFAESNMKTFRKLAEAFKDYYDLHEYNQREKIASRVL